MTSRAAALAALAAGLLLAWPAPASASTIAGKVGGGKLPKAGQARRSPAARAARAAARDVICRH